MHCPVYIYMYIYMQLLKIPLTLRPFMLALLLGLCGPVTVICPRADTCFSCAPQGNARLGRDSVAVKV